jgi:beta-galactosidase
MYFGVDYHPEHWVYPYAGTPEEPEARWKEDARLMAEIGVNVIRMGDYVWGVCEPEEEKYDFAWLKRAMDVMASQGIEVILCTPTAAPPIWLVKKHPEILPVNEHGRRLCEGTRHHACLNSDVYWDYSKRIIRAMATALGEHPKLIGWQIDQNLGGRLREYAFNDEVRRDWHAWLQAKYETIDKLNELLGLRHFSQMVRNWSDVPMPVQAPTVHNPALELDWKRFCSDTAVAFVRMQAGILHEITPSVPVTTNLRSFSPSHLDLFDVSATVDFVSAISNANIKSRSAENACELDLMRSLKKSDLKMPGGDEGFWVIEQKAGHVNWQEVNSLTRPGVVRLFTHQAIARGADGILYFFWRQPRIGSEKFYGCVLNHSGTGNSRVYNEIKLISEEIKRLGTTLKGTRVAADACILVSNDNEWSLAHSRQPNKFFNQRDHIQLFHSALHDRNIGVDFARPSEDLSKYKLVFAPSLQLLAGGEADNLKLYVQNGGTLVSTFNTGLLDEHHIAPDCGYPHDLTDLFGMQVTEFDPVPPGEENHLTFKGGDFHPSHMHPTRLWCDIIEPKECQIMATYAKDFYAGKPAMTMNEFGLGRAIYIGTMSHQPFYYDLVAWLRQLVGLSPLLKVPDTVEVSMRQNDDTRIYFLLNHQSSPVRIQFYKPMHDFLSGKNFTGNYDLPPHGVLILDEHPKAEAHKAELAAEAF